MAQFVVLRHEPGPASRRGLHWDFLLEAGPVLRTWSLDREPQSGQQSPAEALPDHRLEYLTYEGPLTNGRGLVRQWDSGDYSLTSEQANEVVVELQGRVLVGTAVLRCTDATAQRWTFEFSPRGPE